MFLNRSKSNYKYIQVCKVKDVEEAEVWEGKVAAIER